MLDEGTLNCNARESRSIQLHCSSKCLHPSCSRLQQCGFLFHMRNPSRFGKYFPLLTFKFTLQGLFQILIKIYGSSRNTSRNTSKIGGTVITGMNQIHSNDIVPMRPFLGAKHHCVQATKTKENVLIFPV